MLNFCLFHTKKVIKLKVTIKWEGQSSGFPQNPNQCNNEVLP